MNSQQTSATNAQLVHFRPIINFIFLEWELLSWPHWTILLFSSPDWPSHKGDLWPGEGSKSRYARIHKLPLLSNRDVVKMIEAWNCESRMMIMCTIARWNTQILDKELAVVNLETFYDREDKSRGKGGGHRSTWRKELAGWSSPSTTAGITRSRAHPSTHFYSPPTPSPSLSRGTVFPSSSFSSPKGQIGSQRFLHSLGVSHLTKPTLILAYTFRKLFLRWALMLIII